MYFHLVRHNLRQPSEMLAELIGDRRDTKEPIRYWISRSQHSIEKERSDLDIGYHFTRSCLEERKFSLDFDKKKNQSIDFFSEAQARFKFG